MSESSRTKPRHPGEVLFTHFLKPKGTTVADAAAQIGLSAQHLQDIVSGNRDVTAQTAVLLARLTRTTPEFWLRLQETVDVYHAQSGTSPAR